MARSITIPGNRTITPGRDNRVDLYFWNGSLADMALIAAASRVTVTIGGVTVDQTIHPTLFSLSSNIVSLRFGSLALPVPAQGASVTVYSTTEPLGVTFSGVPIAVAYPSMPRALPEISADAAAASAAAAASSADAAAASAAEVADLVVGGAGRLLAVDVYTTPGNHTWTKPEGCTAIEVTMVGGGGGGGRCDEVSEEQGAAAGAGGGAAAVWFRKESDIPSTYALVVGEEGAGAAAGVTAAPGSEGSASTIGPAGAEISAPGGEAGQGGDAVDVPVGGVGGGPGGLGGAGGGLGHRNITVDALLSYDGEPGEGGGVLFAVLCKPTRGGTAGLQLGPGAARTATWSSTQQAGLDAPERSYGTGGGGGVRRGDSSGNQTGGKGTGGIIIIRSYA